MNKLFKVFVYGTLKEGFPNYHLLQNPPNGTACHLGSGYTKETYPLVVGTDANIPFLLPLPGQGKHIKGEIFEVDLGALEDLDKLEQHPTWYKRMECQIITLEADDTSAEKELSCEAYFLVNPKDELLQQPFVDEFTTEHGQAYKGPGARLHMTDLKSQVQS